MTRRGKSTRIFTQRRRHPLRRIVSWLPIAALIIFAAIIAITRGLGDGTSTATEVGPVHVHALGLNAADRSLYIATHTGLFRLEPNEPRAVRVNDRHQDTMGFTVTGPNRFLGSGHPDMRDNLPPLLGLIASTDAGRTWSPISLLGKADFHVLRSAGARVYGYDSSSDELLVSTDEGRSWDNAERPAPLIDLVTDPRNNRHLIASGVSDHAGLYESSDAGTSWKRIGDAVGLLAWPVGDRLFFADGRGNFFRSTDGGRSFDLRGSVGGRPAALLGLGADEFYVALHDGTIMHSTDGGTKWSVRSAP